MILMGVHDAMRKIWLKSGLSQQDLAEKINAKYPDDKISVAGVSRVLSGGTSNPTQRTIEKIAWGLGVDVADFYNDDARVSYKLAMQRLEGLTPEVIEALSDKNRYGYLLMGLKLGEEGLSLKEVEHMLEIYKTMKEKLKGM